MAAIRFPEPELFASEEEKKISLLLPVAMLDALDQLCMKLDKDRSKCIRWCLEEVLKQAAEKGVITLPGLTKPAA